MHVCGRRVAPQRTPARGRPGLGADDRMQSAEALGSPPLYIYMYMYVYIYTYISMYVYISLSLSIYIYIYICIMLPDLDARPTHHAICTLAAARGITTIITTIRHYYCYFCSSSCHLNQTIRRLLPVCIARSGIQLGHPKWHTAMCPKLAHVDTAWATADLRLAGRRALPRTAEKEMSPTNRGNVKSNASEGFFNGFHSFSISFILLV